MLERGNAWTLVFLALPLVHFLIHGIRGFGDTDRGFVTGLSWRILQGERIYLDFIYIRPPLTPYLHALVLWLVPDSYGVMGERLLFGLMIWASVALSVATMARWFDFGRIGVSPPLLGAFGFVFSAYNLSPMPWHTVDGIFFASLGFFLLARKDRWSWSAAGVAALLLAASAKQSFYPLPGVGVVLVAILYGRRRALQMAATVLVMAGLPGLGLWLWQPELLSAGLVQTGLAGDFADLLDAGVAKYGRSLGILAPFLLLVWWLRRRPHGRLSTVLPGLGLWLIVVVGLAQNLYRSSIAGMWTKAPHVSQALFLLAVGVGVIELRRERRRGAVLLALLAVAWCSSISWGLKNPLLGFTPAVFGCMLLVREYWGFVPGRAFHGVLLALIFGFYALLGEYPYRDDPRSTCRHHLGDLFPRLSGVYTSSWNYHQHQELRMLVRKHGSAYTVLPAMPLANYLTHTSPTLPIDWALNVELNYERWKDRVLRQLDQRTTVAFVQKRHLPSLEQPGHRLDSWITRHVLDRWTKIEDHRHFAVYRKPAAQ